TKTTSPMSGTNFNIRPPLIHGAPDSQNSSGQDSGLSSGGADVDHVVDRLLMYRNDVFL
ncbi:unnamed protein product, partial [Rotaria sp. Silwood1]